MSSSWFLVRSTTEEVSSQKQHNRASVVVLVIPILGCEKNTSLPCKKGMSFSWCLKSCNTFPVQTKIPGGSRSSGSWVEGFVLVVGSFFLHVLFLLHKFWNRIFSSFSSVLEVQNSTLEERTKARAYSRSPSNKTLSAVESTSTAVFGLTALVSVLNSHSVCTWTGALYEVKHGFLINKL